jgi:hypothetical protein
MWIGETDTTLKERAMKLTPQQIEHFHHEG